MKLNVEQLLLTIFDSQNSLLTIITKLVFYIGNTIDLLLERFI